MIMSFDEISNTGLRLGLGLGLGLHDHQSEKNCMKIIERQKRKEDDGPSKCNDNKAYPSLTLGPIIVDDDDHQLASKTEASSPSAVSSFSNSSNSIKKERDQFLGEEFDVEVDDEKVNHPSRSRDVDEDGNQRKKLRLTKEQSQVLEENFKEHSTLNPKQKQELATKLNLRARQVEVWFQNRRARTKLKQTELDCELMRKCCETLREENKRLQKELQELKSMQTIAPVAAPFYMHIPATICPSCERICGGNIDNKNIGHSPNTTTTLLIDSKPHHSFYKNTYPFTHSSSTTC